MIKNLIFCILIILLASSSYAISLDTNQTVFGKEKQLSGNILLPKDTYNKDTRIKISIGSETDEKTIHEVVNCSTGCTSKTSASYKQSTTASVQEIEAPNFLTGIKLRKGSTVNLDARFNISNSDSNFPDTPQIDIGNDGIIEWKFNGKAPTSINWEVNPYKGADMEIPNAEELNLDSTGSCQKIFLNKSDTFRVSTTLRKSIASPPSLGVYIHGVETNLQNCNPAISSSFSNVECTLSLENPIEKGEYFICLTAPSTGIVLAVNDTSTNSNGFRCTSSSCKKTHLTDYAIKSKASNFITTLQSTKEYKVSNIRQNEFFKDAVANFLLACTFDGDFCIVPINVTSKGNNNVKLHGLDYIETAVDGIYNRNRFLSGVTAEGVKSYFDFTTQQEVPISNFEILTPKKTGNYTLKVEYNLREATADIEVVEGPTAKANVSATLAETSTSITFDASRSLGKGILYEWDFGDNRTSTEQIVTQSYSFPGIYKVILKVTDEHNISDTAQVSMDIFSQKASEDLINNTLSRIKNLEESYRSSDNDIKEVYFNLKIDEKIKESISLLESSKQLTEEEVNEIINEIPFKILPTNTLKVSPYLSSTQIDELYGFESDSYKTTLREVNTKFTNEVSAKVLSLTYPKKQETFLLVSRKVITPEPIKDVFIIEIIPKTLAPLEDIVFLDSFPEVTKLQDHYSARYTLPNFQDEFTLTYKINSNNINSIRDTISVIMPQDLSPALTPFNCGDGICNPAEDQVSCPEDCEARSKGKPSRGFPWLTYIITMIVIIGGGFAVWKFKLYKRIRFDRLLKKINLISKKSPFKSGVELSKVRSYIQSALEKGYDREKIESSLIDRGWSKDQVDYAFKKLNEKKK